MDKISISTYRKVAVTLWAVVSVVAGLTLGSMFELSPRKMVFSVVAVVGVYVLFIVRMYKNSGVPVEKSIEEHVNGYKVEKEHEDEFKYKEPVNNEVNEVDVEKMQNNEERTSGNETQEWLDKFLVLQQGGEHKRSDEDIKY
jgi:hypothetical protein